MKLLVIEDEPIQLTRITRYFRRENYFCDTAERYSQALQKIENFHYDCIILDPDLPDGDGLTLIKYLREDNRRSGVIIISRRDSMEDTVAGLNAGADDYIPKPLHLSELKARVNALLRRKFNAGQSMIQLNPCCCIDLDSHTVTCKANVLPLRRSEYHLFLFLATHRNHIVPLQTIAEHLFDGPSEKAPEPDYIYGHIKNLKRKLKEAGCPDSIRTVYGVGYKLTL